MPNIINNTIQNENAPNKTEQELLDELFEEQEKRKVIILWIVTNEKINSNFTKKVAKIDKSLSKEEIKEQQQSIIEKENKEFKRLKWLNEVRKEIEDIIWTKQKKVELKNYLNLYWNLNSKENKIKIINIIKKYIDPLKNESDEDLIYFLDKISFIKLGNDSDLLSLYNFFKQNKQILDNTFLKFWKISHNLYLDLYNKIKPLNEVKVEKEKEKDKKNEKIIIYYKNLIDNIKNNYLRFITEMEKSKDFDKLKYIVSKTDLLELERGFLEILFSFFWRDNIKKLNKLVIDIKNISKKNWIKVTNFKAIYEKISLLIWFWINQNYIYNNLLDLIALTNKTTLLTVFSQINNVNTKLIEELKEKWYIDSIIKIKDNKETEFLVKQINELNSEQKENKEKKWFFKKLFSFKK